MRLLPFLPIPLGRAGSAGVVDAAAAADEPTGPSAVLVPALAVVAAVVVAFLVAALVGTFVRRVARRSEVAADLSRRSRRPLRATLVVLAVGVALRLTTEPAPWRDVVEHLLVIALIVAVTWLIGSLAFVLEDAALARYRVDVADNRHARRVRTQVQVLRRLTVAVLVVCAIAGVALTFPVARTFGASLLASAGLISIVAGLAAQSSLANVFAGLQLAFTDAIRVDDVVVVDDEWGRIEEITLTYVVVHVWDDRRLILPSTYFTTTPFENWTRRDAHLLGTVELDLDWDVPVEEMRAELDRLLRASDLWDERVGILQVTDAVGGHVRVRALASAVDAPTLFDLRCYVREGLVSWLQHDAPAGQPTVRVENRQRALRSRPAVEPQPVGVGEETSLVTRQNEARLFTGSIDAIERSQAFAGPGQDVIDQREEAAGDRPATEVGGAPRVAAAATASTEARREPAVPTAGRTATSGVVRVRTTRTGDEPVRDVPLDPDLETTRRHPPVRLDDLDEPDRPDEIGEPDETRPSDAPVEPVPDRPAPAVPDPVHDPAPARPDPLDRTTPLDPLDLTTPIDVPEAPEPPRRDREERRRRTVDDLPVPPSAPVRRSTRRPADDDTSVIDPSED